MVMLVKNSVGMKGKIQMRMLGAVVILYSLLVISGIFTTKARKTTLDKVNNSIAFLQSKISN